MCAAAVPTVVTTGASAVETTMTTATALMWIVTG